jgi:hypothetical protein
MLGFDTVDRALVHQPSEMVDVDAPVWERVVAAWDDRRYRTDVAGAFRNGRVFLDSRDGLRGRRPVVIEWKGGQRAIGAEPVPVDLRVDHVFLVSCKYASRILLNAAPGQLFGWPDVVDWYAEVAPDQYQALYRHVRSDVGADGLPPRAADLARHHRAVLREALGPAGWDGDGGELYAALSTAVSEATADRWRDRLAGRRRQEAMLWRLLRIGAAPYYVLGASRDQTLRLRVTTPWDWRRRFEFRRFDVWADQAGQPRVGWRATVRDHAEGADRTVDGHVEIRWSHGRFAQAPEAKVYLDTPHADVPGYVPLR